MERFVRADFVPNEYYWEWLSGKKGKQEAEDARKRFESTGRLPGDPEDVPEELLALRLKELGEWS